MMDHIAESERLKNTQDNFLPIPYVLRILSPKWRMPILHELNEHGPLRFSELRNRISGITNLMLTQNLKQLEELNLVHRQQFNEIPPRVEYTLTPTARELLPALYTLAQWARRHWQSQQESEPGE